MPYLVFRKREIRCTRYSYLKWVRYNHPFRDRIAAEQVALDLAAKYCLADGWVRVVPTGAKRLILSMRELKKEWD